jgi:hypothetical protein
LTWRQQPRQPGFLARILAGGRAAKRFHSAKVVWTNPLPLLASSLSHRREATDEGAGMRGQYLTYCVSLAALAIIGGALAQTAGADQAETDPATVEQTTEGDATIVVTARKRRAAHRCSFGDYAFTQEQIQKSGIESVADLALQTPASRSAGFRPQRKRRTPERASALHQGHVEHLWDPPMPASSLTASSSRATSRATSLIISSGSK